jgi:putative nucleotidyltransferase with HDIG domain
MLLSIELPSYKILNHAFIKHVRSFGKLEDRVRDHFDLKINHTYHVVRNIQQIARQEGFDERSVQLARIIALFHDIGRFRQFRDYGTFNDAVSLNHAELSVSIIHDEGIDLLIPADFIDLITRTILQHNLFRISETADDQVILFSKLLRDADKIDIWKLQSETDIVYALENYLPADHYHIPDEIYQSFMENHVVSVQYASSINDFRLLRLGWIFDMNFPATFSILLNKGYAQAILARIPDSCRLQEITGVVLNYMDLRALR